MEFALSANKHVEHLGIHWIGEPPKAVSVLKVASRGWAHVSGVVAGDVLVSVDGALVRKLTMHDLQIYLQSRPLTLTFWRADPDAEGQWVVNLDRKDGTSLGLLVGPGHRVARIEPDQLIDQWNLENPLLSVRPGHRIVMVNGEREDLLSKLAQPGKLYLALEEDQFSKELEADSVRLLGNAWKQSQIHSYGDEQRLEAEANNRKRKLMFKWSATKPAVSTRSGSAPTRAGKNIVLDGATKREYKVPADLCNFREHRQHAGKWCVTIDRRRGLPLGMLLFERMRKVTPTQRVVVVAVKTVDLEGLVPDWNDTHPTDSICLGDRIVSANGKTLVKDILHEVTKSTVLHLMVKDISGAVTGIRRKGLASNPWQLAVLEASSAVDSLGFTASAPPGRVLVQEVVDESWAQRCGIAVGDEIVSLDEEIVESMTADAFVKALDVRPLLVEVFFGSDAHYSQKLHVIAGVEEEALGFSASFPPGRVFIEDVSIGSWAARSGISVGDELALMNNRAAESMLRDDFLKAMQQRPLKLDFVLRHVSRRKVAGQMECSHLMDAFAGPADESLGFVVSMPPGRVFIEEVSASSWAEFCGIAVGDEVVAFNRIDISSATEEQLLAAMRRRPLHLQLAKHQRTEVGVSESVQPSSDARSQIVAKISAPQSQLVEVVARSDERSLGLVTSMPPGKVFVQEVILQSWAERCSISIGDELVSLNENIVESLSPERFFDVMRERPLKVKLLRKLAEAKLPFQRMQAPRSQLMEILAAADEATLGFVTNFPPGRVFVRSVSSQSWADRNHIAVGDELITLNDQSVEAMSEYVFTNALQRRPLRMEIDARLDASNTQVLDVVASIEDVSLGFAACMPPGNVFVLRVDRSSWADRCGLQVGDEIMKMNGRIAESMTEENFHQAMQERPLRLKLGLRRAEGIVTEPVPDPQPSTALRFVAESTVSTLGLVASLPPGRVFIREVSQGSWSESNDIRVGDELRALNGTNVKAMTSDSFEHLLQERPLVVELEPRHVAGNSRTIHVTASSVDRSLGFTTCMPPGQVFVQDVMQDSWAEVSGIAVGDELIAVNAQIAKSLSEESFIYIMKERPLTMEVLVRHEANDRSGYDPHNLYKFDVVVHDGDHLGCTFGGAYPRRVVETVQHGTLAQERGVLGGIDELLAVNRLAIADFPTLVEWTSAMKVRPCRLTFGRNPKLAPVKAIVKKEPEHTEPVMLDKPRERGFFELTVHQAVETFGFWPAAFPPERMLIELVQPGTWADTVGLVPWADEVVAVDGASVSSLTRDQLIRRMKHRPLALTFMHHDSLPGKVTTSPSEASKVIKQGRQNKLESQPSVAMLKLGIPMVPGKSRRHMQEGFGADLLERSATDPDARSRFHPTPEGGALELDEEIDAETFDAIGEESTMQMGSYEVRVPAGVGSLGFSTGVPPDAAVIQHMHAGGWAAKQGLLTGLDKLVGISGKDVARMSETDFLTRMQQRPLQLTFVRLADAAFPESRPPREIPEDADTFVLDVPAEVESIGLTPDFPPEPVLIQNVVPGSWAERQHLIAGVDEIIFIAGKPVSDMEEKDFVRMLRQRPVQITIWRHIQQSDIELATSLVQQSPFAAEVTDAVPPETFDLEVSESTQVLGFSTESPPKRLRVKEVKPQTWADEHGLCKDIDELVAIDGRAVSTMKKMDVRRGLQVRPLRLTFIRRNHGCPPDSLWFVEKLAAQMRLERMQILKESELANERYSAALVTQLVKERARHTVEVQLAKERRDAAEKRAQIAEGAVLAKVQEAELAGRLAVDEAKESVQKILASAEHLERRAREEQEQRQKVQLHYDELFARQRAAAERELIAAEREQAAAKETLALKEHIQQLEKELQKAESRANEPLLHAQTIKPPPRDLAVKICGLRGLSTDAKDNPSSDTGMYCICEILGVPSSRMKTKCSRGLPPWTWNQKGKLRKLSFADRLQFFVYEKGVWPNKDKLYGMTGLSAIDVWSDGFVGELALEDLEKRSISWFLSVEIVLFQIGDSQQMEDDGMSLEALFGKNRMIEYSGYIDGETMHKETLTIDEAKMKCQDLPGCKGFYYRGSQKDAQEAIDIYFSGNDVVKKGLRAYTSWLMSEAPVVIVEEDASVSMKDEIFDLNELKLFLDHRRMPAALKSRAIRSTSGEHQQSVDAIDVQKFVQPQVLSIRIAGARNLPDLDYAGTSDPFCVCEALGKPEKSVKTKVIRDTTNPEWNETLLLANYLGEDLKFTIYDKDMMKHDVIGEVQLRSVSFCSDGFDGELQLAGTGSVEAFLRVQVSAQGDPPDIDVTLDTVDGASKKDPLRYAWRILRNLQVRIGSYGPVAMSEAPELELRHIRHTAFIIGMELSSDCLLEYTGRANEDLVLRFFRGCDVEEPGNFEFIDFIHAMQQGQRIVRVRAGSAGEPSKSSYFLGLEVFWDLNHKLLTGEKHERREFVKMLSARTGLQAIESRAENSDFVLSFASRNANYDVIRRMLRELHEIGSKGPWGKESKPLRLCTDLSLGIGMHTSDRVHLRLGRQCFGELPLSSDDDWFAEYGAAARKTAYGLLLLGPSRGYCQSTSCEQELAFISATRQYVYTHRRGGVVSMKTYCLTAGQTRPGIHVACDEGDLAEVDRLLFIDGEAVSYQDADEKRPIHIAAAKGYDAIVDLLCVAKSEVCSIDSEKATPLHLASESGYGAVVTVLLRAGADANARDVRNRTPLHQAAIGGHLDVIVLLMGARAGRECEDCHGWRALDYAVSRGHAGLVRLLWEGMWAGAAIIEAAVLGDVSDVEHILRQDRKGKVVHLKDAIGHTALHAAAAGGHATLARALLAAAAMPEVQDQLGWTPLHHAAAMGHASIVEVLGEQRINAAVCCNSGLSSLRLAQSKGHADVARVIRGVFMADMLMRSLQDEWDKAARARRAQMAAEDDLEEAAWRVAERKVKSSAPQSQLVEVLARRVDRSLGFVTSMPPGRVFVQEVTPQSWAERNSISCGDELVSLNDDIVEPLTEDRFFEIMRVRPLKIQLLRLKRKPRWGMPE